jgi:hypothetical protein
MDRWWNDRMILARVVFLALRVTFYVAFYMIVPALHQ